MEICKNIILRDKTGYGNIVLRVRRLFNERFEWFGLKSDCGNELEISRRINRICK